MTIPSGIRRFALLVFVHFASVFAYTQETPVAVPPPASNEEIIRIYQEDQADRQPKDGQMMEGRLMRERDTQRHARVMAIYQADGLKTGQDYYNAAYVMQHGGDAGSYLLAHEFSMAALALGYERARWITAASYDRLLKSLGQPQRFGTQYSNQGGGPMKLHQVGDGVRDSLRRMLKVPSLDSAKSREAEMTKRFPPSSKPILSMVSFAPDRPPPPEFDVLDLKAGDTAPEAITQPAPEYPTALLPEKLTGSVILTAVIERDGSASNIKVGKASHDAFAAAASAALGQWTFKPGLKQGQPARVIVAIQFGFAPPAAK